MAAKTLYELAQECAKYLPSFSSAWAEETNFAPRLSSYLKAANEAYTQAVASQPLFPLWDDWDVVTRFEKLFEWLKVHYVPAVSQEQNYRLRVGVMARRDQRFTPVAKMRRVYAIAAGEYVPDYVAENGWSEEPPVNAYALMERIGPYEEMNKLRYAFCTHYKTKCPALRWYDKVKVETRMEPTGCKATETGEDKEKRELRFQTLAKKLAWEDDVKVVEAEARKGRHEENQL